MPRFVLPAVLALSALGAAPASAAPLPAKVMRSEITYVSPVGDDPMVAGHCRVEAVAQETLTGGEDVFLTVIEGAAVAYYPPATPAPVEVRCYLLVNGSQVGSTPGGALAPGVDTTDGQWTIYVTDDADVDLCMVFGLGAGIGPICEDVTSQDVPPQGVVDLVSSVTLIADNLVCPMLGLLFPGAPGVVDVDVEGDVAVFGRPVKDCPPYGS